MTVLLALVAYAVAVAVTIPWWLRRSEWAQGTPRLGIVAWQASVAAVLGSLVLLAVAAALPVGRISFDVGHLLHACSAVLRNRYRFGDVPWSAVVAGAVAASVTVLLTRAFVLRAAALVRQRSRHRLMVDVLACDLTGGDARVVEHHVPLAYCIPGHGGRIVLTSAAVNTLDAEQLEAVIAHERAHLRGRHDLVLFTGEVARAAFPWVQFFRTAGQQTAGLVEMLADDRAAQQVGAMPLASALVGIGSRATPGGAIGVSSRMTPERVMRLVRDPYSPGLWRRASVLLGSGGLLLAPWVIAVLPAWAARDGSCPVPRL